MNTEQQRDLEKSSRPRSGGISLRTLVIIIGAMFLVFGIGAAVMIHSEPDPRPVAPGPHYYYEDPLENI